MLRTRWQKVLIDLWRNRTRTLIVALAVAVGVYAVGVVLSTRDMVVREYGSDLDVAHMASAVIHTLPFDKDLAARISEIPGVAAAEGRRTVRGSVIGEDGKRYDLLLTAIPDWENMQVDAITYMEGAWPPAKRGVVLERQAIGYMGVEMGDTLAFELSDGTVKNLKVEGIAHDGQQMSPDVTGRGSGYVTLDTMGALGLDESYTELRVRVAEGTDDETHILSIVDEVEDQLENSGRPMLGRRIITETYAQPFIGTIVMILSSFGLIVLLLSGFLVINAITALITQQIPQIGVMKLIGARRGQIMSLYIFTVLVYGLIAVVLGIPTGYATARLLMTVLIEWLLNVKPESYAISLSLLLLQVAVGLLLPLFAGLVPVIKGTGITTQKALNDVGVTSNSAGEGWVERILSAVQRVVALQRPVLLAVRNALRHKGRLAQTLVVLILGTALFISVISVWQSVNATVEDFMRFHRYDVSLSMEVPYRSVRLEQAAEGVAGVVEVEGWSEDSAIRQRPDGTESDGIQIIAVPAETTLMMPQVSDGRWLEDTDQRSVVVNSDIIDKEPDVQVGSEIELEIGGREGVWSVVGIVPTNAAGPIIYMDLDGYAYETRTPGQVNRLKVVTTQHDLDFQEEMAQVLFEHYEGLGFEVSRTHSTQLTQQESKLLFTVVVSVLVLMALLLAAVGGLGLTTTMSINILERVREIGVLRAIGGTNLSVRGIVLVEGIVMGLVSWVAGVLLSIPIAAFMSEQLGLALIKVPLSHQYSWIAVVVWFFVLQAVAVVASLGPARDAVRLTIREVLAYE